MVQNMSSEGNIEVELEKIMENNNKENNTTIISYETNIPSSKGMYSIYMIKYMIVIFLH